MLKEIIPQNIRPVNSDTLQSEAPEPKSPNKARWFRCERLSPLTHTYVTNRKHGIYPCRHCYGCRMWALYHKEIPKLLSRVCGLLYCEVHKLQNEKELKQFTWRFRDTKRRESHDFSLSYYTEAESVRSVLSGPVYAVLKQKDGSCFVFTNMKLGGVEINQDPLLRLIADRTKSTPGKGRRIVYSSGWPKEPKKEKETCLGVSRTLLSHKQLKQYYDEAGIMYIEEGKFKIIVPTPSITADEKAKREAYAKEHFKPPVAKVETGFVSLTDILGGVYEDDAATPPRA